MPTLYNVVTGGEGATPRGSRVAAIKERFNMDTKAEERGEDRSSGPAGVPSSREDRGSYAGRRSRRNSVTDDSHLTIENFGGSQDNLSMFGRNPDKEPVTVQPSGRRPSVDACTPDSIPPAAGTPSTSSGANYWRRTNNERTRSQVPHNLGCGSTASAICWMRFSLSRIATLDGPLTTVNLKWCRFVVVVAGEPVGLLNGQP